MNWGRLMKRLHRARGMPLDVDGSKRQEQLVRLVLEHPDVAVRSEEHTSELQSPCNLVCRLLLEKKKHLNRTSVSNGTRHGLTSGLLESSSVLDCPAQQTSVRLSFRRHQTSINKNGAESQLRSGL